MRLYKLIYPEADTSVSVEWCPSEAAARTARARIRSEKAIGLMEFRIVPVDIPTTKTPLLEWLNANFSTAGKD